MTIGFGCLVLEDLIASLVTNCAQKPARRARVSTVPYSPSQAMQARVAIVLSILDSCVTQPDSSKKWTQNTVSLGTRSFNGRLEKGVGCKGDVRHAFAVLQCSPKLQQKLKLHPKP